MKKKYFTKIIYLLLITSSFFILFCNSNVNAYTNDDNLENTINDSQLEKQSRIVEEKIVKYDATTGQTTTIDIDELKEKNSLLNTISNVTFNSTKSYSPNSLQYFSNNSIIQPRAMPDSFFTKVNDTSEFPYRVTCRMIINGGLDYGSGFLVAPNLMLTAAHTIYDAENDNEIRDFTVYPAYNGTSYNSYSSGWQAIYRSSVWLETHNREYDWALVELKEDLGNSLGWYGTISYTYDSSLDNLSVRMLGYPKDLGQGKYQYYSSGNIEEIYTRYFIASSGNKGGMSGGPIAINDSNHTNNNYVVGILSANITHLPFDQTYGVRINDYLVDLIRSYINE